MSSVERLYKSARYKVEVRKTGTIGYSENFVFETRNDWVWYDWSNPDVSKRSNVRRSAAQTGDGKSDARTASFTQFAFKDTAVDVKITMLGALTADSVTIRPLRKGMSANVSVDKKVVTFSLPQPTKISVEINDRLDPLFVFGDATEVADTSATYYYGPGVHSIGQKILSSNERVYIDAGAVVEGRFRLKDGSNNISIRGHGILYGGDTPLVNLDPAVLRDIASIYSFNTRNLKVEGLTFVQSAAWHLAIDNTENGTRDNLYRDLKMVSWNGVTDGIWVSGNNNIVDDVFIFNNDDAIVTKGGGNTKVSNVVWWGGVWGRMLLIQQLFEKSSPVDGLTIENVDVIGKEGFPYLMQLEGANLKRDARNVTLRNIVVEERQRVGNSNNTPFGRTNFVAFDSTDNGALVNFTFENISLDKRLPTEGFIRGGVGSKAYTGFRFKNFRIGGELILTPAASRIEFNSNVGVQFLP